MKQFVRFCTILAVALAAFALGSVLAFGAQYLYFFRIYLPQHPPLPGTGVVFGGLSSSFLFGLIVAGVVAAAVYKKGA